MRRTRLVWTAIAVLSVCWTTTTVRGDQERDAPNAHGRHGDSARGDSSDDDRFSAMGHLAHFASTGRLDEALRKVRGRSRGVVTAEHVQEFLDVNLAGEVDDGEDAAAGGQAETSLAVDSTGQHVVIGFNDTRGFALNPVRVSGYLYSDDGGATFVDGGQLPVTTGTSAIGLTFLPQVFGDPEIKYLGGSTFIYFSIMVKKFSATGTAQTMCVHRSTDYGHSWQGPYEIPPATNPHGLLNGASARDAADKEFASVDPDTGRVILSWSNFTSTTFAAGGVEISTTFSDDVASATPPTWSTRSVVAKAAVDGQSSQPSFAGNGSSNAYVVWRRFTGGFSQNVGFARSTDSGQTWTAPVNLTASFLTSDEILGNDRTNTSPSMAVDNSPGPSSGNVYVVYANNAAHDGADIMFQRSLDGGVSFSGALSIDRRPGSDRAQWFPWATVDATTGRVYVFYYDQGIATSGDLTETTMQFSDDGGLSWSKPTPLTDRPFHAAYGNDTGQPNIGDYNQAVAQNGELFAVWAGTTPVGFADGQPSTSMTTPDIVFKRLPAANTKVSLSLGAVSLSEAGNGFIDPGDSVSLTLPLSNYVTNGINAAPVTSVSATLSTTTAGVSVLQATQPYGTLAPGSSANNVSPFVVQIDQRFVPGTHIEFSLAVSSAQGSVVLPFTQSTGTPVPTTIFSENFEGSTPGAGWTSAHAGGSNTVPWTINSTFTGSNAAFHQNLNDSVTGTANTRFERMFSPAISVPAASEYVTLDFDVKYDTEDDPGFNILAYDGFLLRVTDITPGRTLRSVQIESFAEEFTTGAVQFYPKKMPRNSNTSYLQDLSAWAGDSNGVQHVHLKLPGMAGSTVQLRWEYTQDGIGICTDVRPTPRTCGVAFDNVVMNSVVSSSVITTSTAVASSSNPSDSGEPVAFTATVTAGSPVTTGTVTFREGAAPLASAVPVDGSGHAAFSTASLTPGPHTITADYSGPPQFGSSSGGVAQTVDALPTISITDVSIAEGNSGTTDAVFAVSLSARTHTATVQVSYATADGTASSASDYAARADTLAFAPGETTRTIAVTVNGDNVFEPDETFFVNLSGATHATIADAQGQGTIGNDDGVPTMVVNDVSVVEGNTGTTAAVFTVSLSNPSSSAVSVNFATADGTATTANHDYAAATGTVLFAPLETTKTISVSVFGDFVIEPRETFFVNLAGPSGATIADGQGAGTIQNDDTVQTTLAALVDQVGQAAGRDRDAVGHLLDDLADARRGILRLRPADAIKELQDFIEEVRELSVERQHGSAPWLDPSTAAVWIAEAQSIVAALMTT